MSDKVFSLAYVDYEEYVPYLFIGSEFTSEEAFSNLCDSLVDTAAVMAIAEENSRDHSSWVGWHDIVKQLVILLEKEGYVHFEPKLKIISGSNVINSVRDAKTLSHGVAEKVLRYNEELARELKFT